MLAAAPPFRRLTSWKGLTHPAYILSLLRRGSDSMKDVLTGRVDLVRALASGGSELQEAVARLLGLEPIPPQPPAPIPRLDEESPPDLNSPPPALELDTPPIPFWYAAEFESHDTIEQKPGEIVSTPEPAQEAVEPAVHAPLASDAAILTRLRRVSGFSRTRGEPDVNLVVDQLSRGRFLEVLPRRTRKSWGQSLQCIVDRHRRLAPYWDDQDAAVRALSRVYPRVGFQVAVLVEGAGAPALCWPRRDDQYQLPEPGTTVVVLGDLGCLETSGFNARESWIERGRRYRENGNRPVALVPCDLAGIPAELTDEWTIIPWEVTVASGTAALSAREADQAADQILTLLSFAFRVEPWLIREVRRLLPAGRRDPGIESRVWQNQAFQSRHCEAASFRPEEAEKRRSRINAESPDLRRKVYELARRARQAIYPGVWYAELLGLESEAESVGLPTADLDRATWWFQNQRQLAPDGDEALWFRRVLTRLPRSAYQGRASSALHEIWSRVASPEDQRPAGLVPSRLPTPPGASPRTIDLRQAADGVLAKLVSANQPLLDLKTIATPPGSPIALIRTRNPWIKAETFTDRPPWASEWGEDRFGFWCAFRVKGVRQRLRWIPPGEFLMGSLADEIGRYKDEGPRHPVRITRGFWLFDTPCTQDLWEAVMEENPSYFRSPTRPVEQVSWDDCQTFVERLNGLVEGLKPSLPSEAQWEYACRAGTSTRYPFGDEETQLGDHVWLCDNSGDETHDVGKKLPNRWGVYDMLGNVWEWCQDGLDSDFYAKSPHADPVSSGEAFISRVVRGGSWSSDRQILRSAIRYGFTPVIRSNYLGFRCGEFQSSGPASVGSRGERGESRSERRAEHRSDCESPSETRWLPLEDREASPLAFSNLTTVHLSSDTDALTIRSMTRPDWASAIGRDAFGLWAEFTIKETVRQRLRWIPPGQFLMGSPPREAGRYEWEGPQRTMRIPSGFWLFDTPCTQELWEAVMEDNPSLFRSPTRPVEQVNWDDCQLFVNRLNSHLKGLELSLPSEAQWEYACRAGTTTATYAGDLEIKGDHKAPLLDAIAWYGGNCGVDYELAVGYDMSRSPEKQYDFKIGGTHPVRGKAPNSWGLYDMLGNVWEWCKDPFRNYESTAEAFGYRVSRGGSWGSTPRYVRAVSRSRDSSDSQANYLGFRCGEFQAGQISEESAMQRAAQPPNPQREFIPSLSRWNRDLIS